MILLFDIKVIIINYVIDQIMHLHRTLANNTNGGINWQF